MANKEFNLEEYQKMCQKDMEFFTKLDKQIEQERQEEGELLSKMTDEERLKYLSEKSKKVAEAAQGKFKETVSMSAKKDEE